MGKSGVGVVEMESVALGDGTANSMSQSFALKAASAARGVIGMDCVRMTAV